MRFSTSSETVAGPRNLAFRELCLAIECPCVYLFLECLDVCGQEHPQETLRQRAKGGGDSKAPRSKQNRNAAPEWELGLQKAGEPGFCAVQQGCLCSQLLLTCHPPSWLWRENAWRALKKSKPLGHTRALWEQRWVWQTLSCNWQDSILNAMIRCRSHSLWCRY